MNKNTETTVDALRLLFADDTMFYPPTENQLKAMNSLINDALEIKHKWSRILVLRHITGIHALNSSRQLTAHIASVMITFLKKPDSWEIDNNAKETLADIESSLREQIMDRVGPAKKRAKKQDKVQEIEADAIWF